MSSTEPPGEPALQPPVSIRQLVEVVTDLTQLIKDQAVDLRASKRLARLLRDQQLPDERRQHHAHPLHQDLDRVPTIIDDLGATFVEALRAAADAQERLRDDASGQEGSGQLANVFETLGLNDQSQPWSLKYHTFQAAKGFAESPPPMKPRPGRFRDDRGSVTTGADADGPAAEPTRQRGGERSRLRRLKNRGPVLKLGNSIVGSGASAIPVVGGFVAEGYSEVKDHLEELGNLANAAGRGIARRIHRVVGKIRGRNREPEPVQAAGAAD